MGNMPPPRRQRRAAFTSAPKARPTPTSPSWRHRLLRTLLCASALVSVVVVSIQIHLLPDHLDWQKKARDDHIWSHSATLSSNSRLVPTGITTRLAPEAVSTSFADTPQTAATRRQGIKASPWSSAPRPPAGSFPPAGSQRGTRAVKSTSLFASSSLSSSPTRGRLSHTRVANDSNSAVLISADQCSAPSAKALAGGSRDLDVTLVTQGSHDRLWMVPYICTRWGRAPVVVVTLSSVGVVPWPSVDFARLPCSLRRLELARPGEVASEDGNAYPINWLRNKVGCGADCAMCKAGSIVAGIAFTIAYAWVPLPACGSSPEPRP